MIVKNKISTEELTKVLEAATNLKSKVASLRWGQCLFEALPDDLVDELDRTKLDPYHIQGDSGEWWTNFYQAITKEQIKVISWPGGFWTREEAELNPDYIFLFGDNIIDYINVYQPQSTQAVIRGLPNALGIMTKKNRSTHETAYFNDDDTESFQYWLNKTWDKLQEMLPNYRAIVLSEDIGTGKAKLQEKSPKCWALLQEFINKVKQL